MTSRIGRIFIDSAPSCLIALALLFCAEALLRIAYPEEVLETAEERRRLRNLAFTFQPDFLVALKPDVSKTFERSGPNGGQIIYWRTNAAGFRGRPLAVEVINAGLVGSGPDQSLIRLSADIGTHRPHRVVFHIFADNDFGDLIRNRLFELDADGAPVRSGLPATVDPYLRNRQPRLMLVKAARRIRRSLAARFFPPASRKDLPAAPSIEYGRGESC